MSYEHAFCLLKPSHTHTWSSGDDDILANNGDGDLASHTFHEDCDSDRTMKTTSMVLANANLWLSGCNER